MTFTFNHISVEELKNMTNGESFLKLANQEVIDHNNVDFRQIAQKKIVFIMKELFEALASVSTPEEYDEILINVIPDHDVSFLPITEDEEKISYDEFEKVVNKKYKDHMTKGLLDGFADTLYLLEAAIAALGIKHFKELYDSIHENNMTKFNKGFIVLPDNTNDEAIKKHLRYKAQEFLDEELIKNKKKNKIEEVAITTLTSDSDNSKTINVFYCLKDVQGYVIKPSNFIGIEIDPSKYF